LSQLFTLIDRDGTIILIFLNINKVELKENMRKFLMHVIIPIVIILVDIIATIVVVNIANKETDIIVASWYGIEENFYCLGTLMVKDYDNNGVDGVTFEPRDNVDMQDFILNHRDYIGQIQYNIWGNIISGSLFYYNNNYYILYKNDSEYTMNIMYSQVENADGLNLYFPSMGSTYLILNSDSIDSYDLVGNNKSENGLTFFDYTFKEATKFYSRFDENYCTIDDEKEIICVKCFDVNSNSIDDNEYVSIDFTNEDIEFVLV
jgi:hypothetical protein